ncbi:MAG TPA: hypothetical protein VF487_13165 [Chitinophagaceae bacterium]
MNFQPQFDNDQAVDAADYLFGSKKRKAAKSAQSQAVINQILSSSNAANLSNAQMMTMIANADGKITGKEKRGITKAGRQENKLGKTQSRQDAKVEAKRAANPEPGQSTSIAPMPSTMPGSGLGSIDPVTSGGMSLPTPSGGGGGMDFEIPQEEYQSQAASGSGAIMEESIKKEDTPTPGMSKNTVGIIIIMIVLIAAYLYFKRKK